MLCCVKLTVARKYDTILPPFSLQINRVLYVALNPTSVFYYTTGVPPYDPLPVLELEVMSRL